MGTVQYKICDKCGKKIKYTGWTSKLKNIFQRSGTIPVIKLFNGRGCHEREYELCADCTKKLGNFLMNKERTMDVIEYLSAELAAAERDMTIPYCSGEKELIEEMAEEIENLYGKETKLSQKAREYLLCLENDGWHDCSDRYPTLEECEKSNSRFILDNGTRWYQGKFNYAKKRFVKYSCDGIQEDKHVIRWHELFNSQNP